MASVHELEQTLRERDDEIARLRAEVDAWRVAFDKGAKRDVAFTNSATEVAPLFTALDTEARVDVEVPGQWPFTRGIHPTGYRGKLWTMRQFAGFGTARETNARFKFLLSQGQTGLSVAFDFPTLMGYDADHPRAEGEVGKTGVSVSSLADMETLFDGIPMGRVSTSMFVTPAASRMSNTGTPAARKALWWYIGRSGFLVTPNGISDGVWQCTIACTSARTR